MIDAPDLPTWASLLVASLVIFGALIAFVGSLGLLRFDSYYKRAHAPGLATTLGTTFILLASIICFSVLQSRPVLHELLIGIFVTITTPITLITLSRAALYRDRTEKVPGIPRDTIGEDIESN